MIRPGRTTAAQSSTGPLPVPWRVSRGFLVTGLSGKTRIQSLPPPRAERGLARGPGGGLGRGAWARRLGACDGRLGGGAARRAAAGGGLLAGGGARRGHALGDDV